MTLDRRNGTAKSRQGYNARSKWNLQILGILEADTIKQKEMKEKSKSISEEPESNSRQKTMLQVPYQRNKYLGCTSCKIFGTILEVNQRRT